MSIRVEAKCLTSRQFDTRRLIKPRYHSIAIERTQLPYLRGKAWAQVTPGTAQRVIRLRHL